MARDRAVVRPLTLRSNNPQAHHTLVRRGVAWAAVGTIALAVVVVIVVNAFRLVATDTYVRYEYGRGDLPSDAGLSVTERRSLALLGLESIRPGTDGIALLEGATLRDGTAVFVERELRHMTDVRRLYGRALVLQLALVIGLVGAASGLRRTRHRRTVPRGLFVGSVATLIVAIALVPVMLLGFDRFFEDFHSVFFEGDTWRFARGDTLLRIYPERFWEHTSRTIAVLVVAQALLVAPLAWAWQRRVQASMP
jgi:integral membrane protein (TIGR01906 family)